MSGLGVFCRITYGFSKEFPLYSYWNSDLMILQSNIKDYSRSTVRKLPWSFFRYYLRVPWETPSTIPSRISTEISTEPPSGSPSKTFFREFFLEFSKIFFRKASYNSYRKAPDFFCNSLKNSSRNSFNESVLRLHREFLLKFLQKLLNVLLLVILSLKNLSVIPPRAAWRIPP